MSYLFKVLVVDDEEMINSNFEILKKKLNEDGINIDFKIISSELNYNPDEPYDILMVDYNLEKGFEIYHSMGDELIASFREKNKVSKVIFYSSSFIYDPEDEDYDFPIRGKRLFDLINKLQIDRIAYKSNFNMMFDVIKSCCKQIDYLPVMLSSMLNEYENDEIEVTFNGEDGEEIELSQLINELINDSEKGKYFKKQIMETVTSSLLNYNY